MIITHFLLQHLKIIYHLHLLQHLKSTYLLLHLLENIYHTLLHLLPFLPQLLKHIYLLHLSPQSQYLRTMVQWTTMTIIQKKNIDVSLAV